MNKLESKVLNNKSALSVFNMNQVFGNYPIMYTSPQWKDRVVNQTLNIKDEIDELKEAIENNDEIEMADAVGDIFTFAYGTDYFLSGILNTVSCDGYNADVLNKNWLPDILKDIETKYEDVNNVLNDIINCDEDEHILLISTLAYRLTDLLHTVGNNLVTYDFNDLMNEITRSNLTKVCLNEEELTETVNAYTNKGIEVYTKTDFSFEGVPYSVVYSSKDQQGHDGKVYRKDKFLKNRVRFTEPNLRPIVFKTT